MSDESRAAHTLRRLAEMRAKEEGIDKRLAEKGESGLRGLGIDSDNAMRTAALIKIIQDANQGRLSHDFGNFNVEGEVNPKERKLRVDWKRIFNGRRQ